MLSDLRGSGFNPHTSSHGPSGAELTRLPLNAPTSNQKSNCNANAGGNRVIRYGMTRDLILGLEVVTADGIVLQGLRKHIKNNTGIDLKQLFIGSEGILGVVTRAALRIFPTPAERQVALCALSSFPQVT
ncbi:FAD-binding oxidoreductase [Bradyrhizobium sp. 183]|uniref:FAD-binding oxidoreductase n=1 Tax=unclassified Bradyrhizobium TaxID=2631580 RepID=UPI002000567F|nr:MULTISPECIES: FAD-binding oxidoreductase [unclassified Bradyrhizobium]UPJ79264.1 FAD-binding oxidoreductase [Bradyrhizobium sp. 184]UPJ87057.1 FAD-binding oxidoreductase [Bradyrhizobium sp. 183]